MDKTGCLKAFGTVNLTVLDPYDWRLSENNVWKVERLLFEIPHQPLAYSQARVNPSMPVLAVCTEKPLNYRTVA